MSSGLTEANDLILEDGTGVLDANTWIDIMDVTDYATLRQTGPYQAWLDTDESNHVSAAIFAAQYLCTRWSWRGEISFPDVPQGLCFPRFLPQGTLRDARGIDVSNEVPDVIITAQIEYAVRAIDPTTLQAVELVPDYESPTDESGRIVKSSTEQVASLRESVEFFGSSTFPTQQVFERLGIADQIVKDSGLLAPGQGTGGGAIRN